MYWRIRKLVPQQLIQQYGIHFLLLISVIANILLVVTRPRITGMTADIKQTVDQFARDVTAHLFDTSYISYEKSTTALLDPQAPELSAGVVAMLKQNGTIAKSREEFAAEARSLKEERRVSAIRIDSVNMNDPDSRGWIPVEIKGVVAVHSATDTGPSGPVPFDFIYYVGFVQRNDKRTPIVGEFRDMSPKVN